MKAKNENKLAAVAIGARSQFRCSEILNAVDRLDDLIKTCGERRMWAEMDSMPLTAHEAGYLMSCVAACGNVALLVSLRYYFASKLSA